MLPEGTRQVTAYLMPERGSLLATLVIVSIDTHAGT